MRNFLFSTLVVALFSTAHQAQEQQVSHEMLATVIQNGMQSANISGLSACVIIKNKTVWQGSFGIANRETNLPVNDSTLFQLYSVTKTFTGIALMQLHAQGLFNLDDPINNFLPFQVINPTHPETNITFRMLMSHVSSIRDNWNIINSLMVMNYDSPISLSDFLQNYLVPGGEYYGSSNSYSSSQPGNSFNYSNIGATLAGLLIEEISNMAYTQYIKQHILEPLGMNRSGFLLSETDTTNMAKPYSYASGTYSSSGFRSNPCLPAGFLRSSITEMAEYMKMLLGRGQYNGQTILDSALFESMITEHYPGIAANSGLFFGFDNVNSLWGHSGGENGVKTTLFFDTEQDWGVVVLSNGGGEPWQIAYMLYQYAKDYESITAYDVEIDDANSDFRIEPNETAVIRFRLKNEMLTDFSGGIARFRSTNSQISFSPTEIDIPGIGSVTSIETPLLVTIEAGNFTEAENIPVCLDIFENGEFLDSTRFSLFLGETQILLVSDEEHLYRNRANALQYYQNALIANNKTFYTVDNKRYKTPTSGFLESFETIIWYTGLDNEAIHSLVTSEEQTLLQDFLEGGGNLVMSSQNLGDALGESVFHTQYLHAQVTNPDYTGTLNVQGLAESFTNGLNFNIFGGDGTNTQYSATAIEPLGGATRIFNYSNTTNGAGVAYKGDYGVVYLPFCLAAVSNSTARTEVLRRILQFLSPTSGFENPVFRDEKTILYPNPITNNTFRIKGIRESSDLTVIDELGNMVAVLNQVDPESEIHFPFATGLYFLRIESKNNVEFLPLVIP